MRGVWRWNGRWILVLFFDAIGGKESINRKGILYATQDGMLLADKAREWFRESHGQEITAAGYVARKIKQPILAQVKEVERQGQKRRSVRLMAKMAIAEGVVAGGGDTNGDSDHSSSLPSSDAEITEKNLAQMSQIADKRKDAVAAEVDASVIDYMAESKRRRKTGGRRNGCGGK